MYGLRRVPETLHRIICLGFNVTGKNDDNASVKELASYVDIIYGSDAMDLSTLQGINATRQKLGMDVIDSDMNISMARKSFLEKLARRTGIYAAPVEGATRLACARALMTQTDLPIPGSNKLDCSALLGPQSPAFKTAVPVEVYGPLNTDQAWTISPPTLQTLKQISLKIRGAQDASSTNDVSSAYLGLVHYARRTLVKVNEQLKVDYPNSKTSRVGNDAKTMARTKLAPTVGTGDQKTLERQNMGPFELLFNDYMPMLATYWMKNWGKFELNQKVAHANSKETTPGVVHTNQEFIDTATTKIEKFAVAQKFWFKSATKRNSEGHWTRGVTSEIRNLVNFATVALGNKSMIDRTETFILRMKDNQFKEQQVSDRLAESVLSMPKLLDRIADCVRNAVTIAMKKMTNRMNKQIPMAFFAQAILVDIYEFLEIYGPEPKQMPMMFQSAMRIEEGEKEDRQRKYSDLIDLVLETYPVYLEKTLFQGYEQTCLELPFSDLYGQQMFPTPAFKDDQWAIGLFYLDWFKLQELRPKKKRKNKKRRKKTTSDNDDEAVDYPPLSLVRIGACKNKKHRGVYADTLVPAEKENGDGDGELNA